MKINILLCDRFDGLLPSYIESYPAMFEQLFRRTTMGRELSFTVYDAMKRVLPPIDKCNTSELYLITGCNKSAYDSEPWIVELLTWIKNAVTKSIKLVGICFGHQAIALALGGEVKRYIGGWGVGIRESDILDAYMLDFWNGEKLSILYNHHDQVVELPIGATPLASSPFCKYEGFRIGRQVLTFQGHPEYIVEYEKHLLLNHSHEEDICVRERALESLKTKNHQGLKVAEFILKNAIDG